MMMSKIRKTSSIDQIIDRAVEQNPQSAELLKAFQPIIARQRYLVESIALKELDDSSIDQEKLKAGVSVSHQISLFSTDDPVKDIVLSLASAVKEGMPALAEGLDQFSGLIKKGKLKLNDYFQAYPDQENKVINRWVAQLQIPQAPVLFLMSLIVRVVLESRAKKIAATIGESAWEKGYCPICGEFPSIALIEEEGGKRFLHCNLCGQDWRFTRVVCPYCENEAQQGMDYFYVENKTQESAFVCEKCKKYLITLYRAGKIFERDMDVSAISLIHMDMIMQGKGYEPMAVCSWNVFV